MPASNHILNELSEISQTVANIPQLPVFTVPENYFTNFPEKLMSRIREDAREETSLISPLLGGMDKKTPFKVPDGYFTNLEAELMKSAKLEIQTKQAPVIHMFRKKQVWRLSVAAMIAGLIGISAWLFFTQDSPVFLSSQVTVNSLLPKISEKEIADFLQSDPEIPQMETQEVAGLDNLNLEDMLKDVQDGELQQYIIEKPDLQAEKLN
jgi:hypothetical protein